jgi:uncharacterized protein (DUF1697 family)
MPRGAVGSLFSAEVRYKVVMTTYVALLRAVNVGGHASLAMAGLRDSLTGLGYANARTYLQSGNAVFDAASEAAYSAVYEAAFSKLTLPAAEGERAAFVGTPALATPVVYMYLPHGYGRTKLNNLYFERSLGAAATTRSWRTVRALVDLSVARA